MHSIICFSAVWVLGLASPTVNYEDTFTSDSAQASSAADIQPDDLNLGETQSAVAGIEGFDNLIQTSEPPNPIVAFDSDASQPPDVESLLPQTVASKKNDPIEGQWWQCTDLTTHDEGSCELFIHGRPSGGFYDLTCVPGEQTCEVCFGTEIEGCQGKKTATRKQIGHFDSSSGPQQPWCKNDDCTPVPAPAPAPAKHKNCLWFVCF